MSVSWVHCFTWLSIPSRTSIHILSSLFLNFNEFGGNLLLGSPLRSLSKHAKIMTSHPRSYPFSFDGHSMTWNKSVCLVCMLNYYIILKSSLSRFLHQEHPQPAQPPAPWQLLACREPARNWTAFFPTH